MAEVNDAGEHLRRTRANQPAANTVIGGTLCFITYENVLERSNGLVWESYSAPAAVGTTLDPRVEHLLHGVGALIVFLSQGAGAVLSQHDAENLQRIIDG